MNQVPFIITVAVGIILVITHFILAKGRAYLIYLGAAFIIFAPSIRAEGKFRWMYLLLTGLAVILAMYEALLESRDRLQQMRAEQRDRESAFADLMTELTQIEKMKDEATANSMNTENADNSPEQNEKL